MKRQSRTPRSQIRSALRRLWLRSRERQAALKRDQYTCQQCGIKQSRAKGKEVFVEVDHTQSILHWENMIDYIANHLLVDPAWLETLCKDCHAAKTRKQLGGIV